MTKIVTGKWGRDVQDRWPLGRGVAIYMRPKTAKRHLDAGMRLGDRVIAVGAGIRRVLHDLFAPLDLDKLAEEYRTEPQHKEPEERQERQEPQKAA